MREEVDPKMPSGGDFPLPQATASIQAESRRRHAQPWTGFWICQKFQEPHPLSPISSLKCSGQRQAQSLWEPLSAQILRPDPQLPG